MTATKVFTGDEARKRFIAGARIVSEVIRATAGPLSGNVMFKDSDGSIRSTHDGVTAGRSVVIPIVDDETLGNDEGAEFMKAASDKLELIARDGTTAVSVLTQSLLDQGDKFITAGFNKMQLRQGIESARDEILNYLDEFVEPVTVGKKLVEVATISAGDPVLGKMIAEITGKLGKEGVITVEKSLGPDISYEILKGFRFDRGYASDDFVTDSKRNEAVIDSPLIVVADMDLNDSELLVPLFDSIYSSGNKKIVVIAKKIEGTALMALSLNKKSGSAEIIAVNAPSYGDEQAKILRDIAAYTGANIISDAGVLPLKEARISNTGTARKVVSGIENTTIIGTNANKALKRRIDSLEAEIASTTNAYLLDRLNSRLASLRGRAGVISVGGSSDIEVGEKKDRIDDAVGSTRNALIAGTVPGGGVTLVNLSQRLAVDGGTSFAMGRKILKNALLEPFLAIVGNAGLNSQALIGQLTKEGYGVDVRDGSGSIVNMRKAGVIDPVVVTREVIKEAVSRAGIGITMGKLVARLPEKEGLSE